MERRKSDFDDKSYFNFKRPKREKRSIGNCKKIKRKRIEKADRLDDIRTVGNVCILLLKFFVLLNLLVITSKML